MIRETLLNRRTIRKYSAKPVEDKLLKEILRKGCRASTTGNMQVYSIVVTRDEEKKKELLPFHFNQKMIAEAPVVLTFCADFNRFNKWCLKEKRNPDMIIFCHSLQLLLTPCLLRRLCA